MLTASLDHLSCFVSAIFAHADPGTFISLRVFDQNRAVHAAHQIKAVQVNGDLRKIALEAAEMATYWSRQPTVFAPPVATFSNEWRAGEADVANGLAISVELDRGDTTAARAVLESVLGPPTIGLNSGGVWTGDDGIEHPKVHLHWRLSVPTRDKEGHSRLKEARWLAATLVGGDTTAAPACHPLRWPGTWNLKGDTPRPAGVFLRNDACEVDLESAHRGLEDAVEAAGLSRAGKPVSGAVEGQGGDASLREGDGTADIETIQGALVALGNADVDWERWNLVGMATWRASGGSEEGLAAWIEWSRKSDKHDEERCWDRWHHFESSPPVRLGVGSLIWWAIQEGWVPPWRRAVVVMGAIGEIGEGEGAEPRVAVQRPIIPVQDGDLHGLTNRAEEALLESGFPVFQRGGRMVRPVWSVVKSAGHEDIVVARFRKIEAPGMMDLLSAAGDWQKWDGRRKAAMPCDPPEKVAKALLEREGFWRVPVVTGIITSPTLRPDGSVLDRSGFDRDTGLYLTPGMSWHWPEGWTERTWSREEALADLALLKGLLEEFPFGGSVDRAVALSTLITPVVRGMLGAVPMHATKAPAPGSGKSYLFDVAATIATGRACPAISMEGDKEEMEKRVVGALLSGDSVISFDNVNGPLGSDLLCQAVERPLLRIRPLGTTDLVEIENRMTLFANGNGLRFRGDMSRRAVQCSLDPLMERPERRAFKTSPTKLIAADRGRYIAACMGIVKAYRVAGLPGCLVPIGSFERWSDYVRSALVWLGEADPWLSNDAVAADNDDNRDLDLLIDLWARRYGLQCPKTLREINDDCKGHFGAALTVDDAAVYAEFKSALAGIAGTAGDALDTRKLGYWLRGREGRILGGRKIISITDGHLKIKRWFVALG